MPGLAPAPLARHDPLPSMESPANLLMRTSWIGRRRPRAKGRASRSRRSSRCARVRSRRRRRTRWGRSREDQPERETPPRRPRWRRRHPAGPSRRRRRAEVVGAAGGRRRRRRREGVASALAQVPEDGVGRGHGPAGGRVPRRVRPAGRRGHARSGGILIVLGRERRFIFRDAQRRDGFERRLE